MVVEGCREEDPHDCGVAEGIVARGAEEDKVVEAAQIGQLRDLTALEFVQLEEKVSSGEVMRGWGIYEREVRSINDA